MSGLSIRCFRVLPSVQACVCDLYPFRHLRCSPLLLWACRHVACVSWYCDPFIGLRCDPSERKKVPRQNSPRSSCCHGVLLFLSWVLAVLSSESDPRCHVKVHDFCPFFSPCCICVVFRRTRPHPPCSRVWRPNSVVVLPRQLPQPPPPLLLPEPPQRRSLVTREIDRRFTGKPTTTR